jgi:hypothetical protein
MYVKPTLMTKVEKFIKLQKDINLQIDVYGEASTHDVMVLEVIADSMTPEEIDEACQIWKEEIF